MAPRARGTQKSVHSSPQLAFCALMKETRRKAGLTQQELADRLDRPQSFVAKYEGGERRIDVVEFLGVAKALDTDPVALLRALVRRI